MARRALHSEHEVMVYAPAERVLAAFFNPHDLVEWWQVARSVTVARPLGTYAVEWQTTDVHDDVLGRLGGAFHGTVMEYRPGRQFFIADAYWTPPDGDPIGPMAMEVRSTPGTDEATRLVVRQSASDEGERWRRYFEVVGRGWPPALAALKQYLEAEGARTRR
jgi:uncharacterized protein YndB with AHSA1/START domain